MRNEMGEACSTAGEGKRHVYRVLVGKSEGKRPLGRPRRGLEDPIKMDVQDVGCGGIDWIEMGQGRGRMAGTFECGNESSGSIKCGELFN
jgi:hypothetical protein